MTYLKFCCSKHNYFLFRQRPNAISPRPWVWVWLCLCPLWQLKFRCYIHPSARREANSAILSSGALSSGCSPNTPAIHPSITYHVCWKTRIVLYSARDMAHPWIGIIADRDQRHCLVFWPMSFLSLWVNRQREISKPLETIFCFPMGSLNADFLFGF